MVSGWKVVLFLVKMFFVVELLFVVKVLFMLGILVDGFGLNAVFTWN